MRLVHGRYSKTEIPNRFKTVIFGGTPETQEQE
jgi:hypothetical protein